jgi:Putative Flp pilus-assembly TadE/G-like
LNKVTNQGCRTRVEGGRRRGRRESGFVLIVTSLAIVMLLGFLGMAIDVGFLQFQKRRIQSAADGAAQGGAFEVMAHSPDATIVSSAKYDSGKNGFTDGADGVTVTVHYPPTRGFYAGKTNAVEAIVTRSNPTYFMSLFGLSSAPVSARSVARATSSPNCIYVLDPTASGALFATGNGTPTVQCGIVVDSSNSTAATANGNACVTATAITIVGNYGGHSNGCGFQPTPVTGAPSVPDPLSYLTAPTVGPCDHTNYAVSGGIVTLNPGVYCGGIAINGASTIVYLNAGTYVLNGGGLVINGQANVTGTGVMFYNTGDASHIYAPVSINGGSITTLVAPVSGPYEGILFFQDRSISSTTTNMFNGGALSIYTGALYFPTTPLSYAGNSLQNGGYTLIVAKTLTFAGISALSADYSTLPDGSPIKGGVAFGE